MTSVDLPEPDTPVTATKQPSGNSTSMSCEVVLAGAAMTSRSSPGLRRTCRHRDAIACPDRYCPVIESFGAQQALDRPGVDDVAAVLAGARADVDDVVGDPDRLLVVLDDEHRVAEVAQAASSVSISRRLSRWCRPIDGSSSTYSTPDQAAADLGGQPDALRLAAGQRGRRPRQRR